MSPPPGVDAHRGEAAAGELLGDERMERVARVGILSRAANYIVLAFLVAAIIVGSGNHEADRRGAIDAIAGAPLGRVLLILLCVGIVCYVVWQLLRAATHRADQSAPADAGRRVLALVTAVIYVAFLITTVRVLLGSSTSSPNSQQDSMTGRLLSASGGRIIVAVVGIAAVVAGLVLAGYAVTRRFEKPLDMGSMSESMRRTATVLGVAGQMARGLVFVIIGGFIVSAALADDASRSKGMDAALKSLAAARFGAVLLAVVALGFLGFGLWSLIDARYREDFSR